MLLSAVQCAVPAAPARRSCAGLTQSAISAALGRRGNAGPTPSAVKSGFRRVVLLFCLLLPIKRVASTPPVAALPKCCAPPPRLPAPPQPTLTPEKAPSGFDLVFGCGVQPLAAPETYTKPRHRPRRPQRGLKRGQPQPENKT